MDELTKTWKSANVIAVIELFRFQNVEYQKQKEMSFDICKKKDWFRNRNIKNNNRRFNV